MKVTMTRTQLFLFAIFCTLSVYRAEKPSMGSVELDEYTFDKVISKFDAALVKFDVSFPYGDKEEAYMALAKDARTINELLVASVGVKDYGDKENEALARKYGATKENFPVVKLFLKGRTEPITFGKTFTTDELRGFVRQHTGLYVSLPGCDKQLDLLAIKFMNSNKGDRKKIIKEAETVIEKSEENVISRTVYRTIMEKILEKGDDFVKTEDQRVRKILSGKVSNEKKKELTSRLNILQAFQQSNKSKLNEKETKGDSAVNAEL